MNFTHLIDELSNYPADKIIFVGLGNKARGDDFAGIFFINLLRTKPKFKNSKFINAGKNPENHLAEIINHQPLLVVFVDAANWGGKAGDISFIKSETITNVDFSTHAYSIKLVEKFLLLNIKTEFLYIGIQTKCTELGKEMTEEVSSAIRNFFIEDAKTEKS